MIVREVYDLNFTRYTMKNVFLAGLLMRSIVIFLFLGSIRSVIIPIVAIPLSLVGTFFIMLLLGYGSVTQWLHLENKLAVEEQQNKQLAARNRAVEADILELKSGDQALEEQARYELGMVKEGEEYYQCSE